MSSVPTALGVSKNMKFPLSRNSTKFDVVARFLRDDSNDVIRFFIRDLEKLWIFNLNLPFYHSLKNLDFSGFHRVCLQHFNESLYG